MTEQNIKIFTISTCFHCKSLKKLLDEHRISYDFEDVDLMEKDERQAFLAAIEKYNEKKTFPVIIIGNKAIVGFQEEVIRKELGIA